MSERQQATTLNKIRHNHVARYALAAKTVSGDVLDAACGCGYGSFILARDCEPLKHVTGIDIDAPTIDFAKQHWHHPKNSFKLQDITTYQPEQKFDWVVSFETIEHVLDPRPFLIAAAANTKNLLCSVPNEECCPFEAKRFPFHFRHYTTKQVKELLEECGFEVRKVLYQDRYSSEFGVRPSWTTIINAFVP